MPGTPLTNNLRPNARKALDDRYGKDGGTNSAETIPFASVAEALSAIVAQRRHRGLTVSVDDGGGLKEYWWRDDVGDNHLILKHNYILFESAATKSDITSSSAKRLVEVVADETNNGEQSLYFHNGVALKQIQTY